MADSGDIHKLVGSAQAGLADAMPLTTAAKRRDLIAAAQVQADCAHALATQNLADVIAALLNEEPSSKE